jgi:opacity protein-like surface antigen
MRIQIMKNIKCGLLSFIAFFAANAIAAGAETQGDCDTCGQVVALPVANLPSYESCCVQPLQGFLAARSRNCAYSYFNGFFFGTGFGYGNVRNRLTTDQLIPTPISIVAFKDESKSYITTKFDIGYGHVFNWFYLGLELAYNYRSFTKPTFIDFEFLVPPILSARVDINSQNAGTADLLPGVALGPQWLIFARLGAEVTSYDLDRRISIVGLDEFQDTHSKSVTNFRAGVGVAYAVSPYVSFNINYIHVFGQSLTFRAIPAAIVFPNDRDITIRPQRDEIVFGINFTIPV